MNIIELLSEHNISYKSVGQHHHATRGWIQIDCPFCGKDTKGYHLGINLDSNFANCWRCGHHTVYSVLSELTDLSNRELANVLGTPLDTIGAPYRTPRPRTGLRLPVGLTTLERPHRNYLKSRGFNPEEVETLWGIQGLGVVHRLSWRIWIPIYFRGELVSWTTRSIEPKATVRYINARPEEEAISHKSLLYGEDYVRGNTIIICEGPIDVWKIGPGAVAILGVNYSREQVEKILKYTRRVICYDSDKPGKKKACKLLKELCCFPGTTYPVELETKDIAEANQKEVDQLRKEFLEDQNDCKKHYTRC